MGSYEECVRDGLAVAARRVGIRLADGDLDLLARTMQRYEEVVLPLHNAKLDSAGHTAGPEVLGVLAPTCPSDLW